MTVLDLVDYAAGVGGGVFGVTADQNLSTNSAWLLTGSQIFVLTYLAPVFPVMNRQVRSIAPYSWSLDRISSPGFRLRFLATILTAVVGFGK